MASSIVNLKSAGLSEKAYTSQLTILQEIATHIEYIYIQVHIMSEARKVCTAISNTRSKAIAYCSQVKESFFDGIRHHVDSLELLVADEYWVLPKYREMLFLR